MLLHWVSGSELQSKSPMMANNDALQYNPHHLNKSRRRNANHNDMMQNWIHHKHNLKCTNNMNDSQKIGVVVEKFKRKIAYFLGQTFVTNIGKFSETDGDSSGLGSSPKTA